MKQATSWLDAAETAPPVRVERVALCSAVSAESVQRVAAAVQPATLSQLGPEDETNGLLADVMFGQPPPAWVLKSRRLRWLQLDSVGFEPYRQLVRPDVRITNIAGMFSVSVAESAIAGLLALCRGICELTQLKQQRRWRKDHLRPTLRDLHGMRVLIAGHGSIGRAMRTRLEAFGCDVVSFARSSHAELQRIEDVDALLPRVDVLVLCLPATPQTTDMFNRERLSRLNPRAFVVNVGRANVLDEAYLVEMLRRERLAGAVLDVTRAEPLPEDDPLWVTPRLVLTQHTAGGNHDEEKRKVAFFLENFQRLTSGKPLLNPIDPKRGY